MPRDDFRVGVTFVDGTAGEVDMRPFLDGPGVEGTELTPGINAFQSWFMVHHPELMKRLPELEALADLAKRMGIDKLPRPEFYRQRLESHQRSYGS